MFKVLGESCLDWLSECEAHTGEQSYKISSGSDTVGKKKSDFFFVRSTYRFQYKHILNENILHSLSDRRLDSVIIACKSEAAAQMDR